MTNSSVGSPAPSAVRVSRPASSAVRVSWPALAALGAGLVHLAVAASGPPALMAGLIVLGVLELVWALGVLRAGRLLLVRAAAIIASAASAAWVAVAFTLGALGVASPAAAVPILPLAVATVFTLYIGFECGRVLRSGRMPVASVGRRLVLGILGGAVIVAALTTPALAATEAGKYAHPHGEHGLELPLPAGHQH